ncbi:MAG: hypothetical protein WC934_02950 [Acidithiobacillus sp.]|jgi:hypothetical protein|uniref:hypothetical protein n=1 Tax=Acidithiobacillus sp. TaxID=1872118 RepID=UPI00355CF4B7
MSNEKEVHLEKSNGWLVLGKPFSNWNEMKPYMQYLDADWIEDCGDMSGNVGWHISDEGILKAQKLGYTIIINDVIIPTCNSIDDLNLKIVEMLQLAKEKQNREYCERQKIIQNEIKIRDEKIKKWDEHKSLVHVQDRDVKYIKKDEIVFWKNISGSKYIVLAEIQEPIELKGVECVHRADHDYDTHYDSYLINTELAEQYNKQIEIDTFTKEKERLISNPSFYDVLLLVKKELDPTYTFENMPNNEIEFRNNSLNRKLIFDRFKTLFIEQQKDVNVYKYGEWNSDLLMVCDYLKITEQVQTIWNEEHIKKQQKQNELIEQQKMKHEQQNMKCETIKSELKSKSKNILLDEYKEYIGNTFQKSWPKNKIVDTLAKKLSSDTPLPLKISKYEKYNCLDDQVGPDY